MSNINKNNFEESTLYALSGNVIEMHKVMVRPYDKYVGEDIKFGQYNEVVSAWYVDIPVKESTEKSCIIRTSYGNDIQLNDPSSSEFTSDDLFFAMHCHNGYIRLWFACDPRDIVNDYIKLGFELASPYVNVPETCHEFTEIMDAKPHYDRSTRYAPTVKYEKFDIILPTHPNCWEKEYDGEAERCKCKFTICDTRIHADSNLSYEYASKVEDFIHCIVPMEGYILIEAYDLPKDREYVRINVSLAINI